MSTTELVAKLRSTKSESKRKLLDEAADTIERLEAERNELAIAALREQEERSEGCDRCSEKLSKDFPFSPAERQRLTLHSKHCAWCGRKLEVEG